MRDQATWKRSFGHLPKPRRTEELLHSQVCKYLKLQYPKVRFKSGMEGERLAGGSNQGLKVKSRNWGAGHPDLVIYHQVGVCCGLMLELKKDKPYKKDGTLKAGEHLQEQDAWLYYLRRNGWIAMFCWEFDHAKRVIDEHLNS